MENGLKDIKHRLSAVRENEDGTVWESHALWNYARRNVNSGVSGRSDNLNLWRANDPIQRGGDSLFNRIL
ncbi:hypothetical protein WAJ30_21190, partial [Acinetobacter baumannii]